MGNKMCNTFSTKKHQIRRHLSQQQSDVLILELEQNFIFFCWMKGHSPWWKCPNYACSHQKFYNFMERWAELWIVENSLQLFHKPTNHLSTERLILLKSEVPIFRCHNKCTSGLSGWEMKRWYFPIPPNQTPSVGFQKVENAIWSTFPNLRGKMSTSTSKTIKIVKV